MDEACKTQEHRTRQDRTGTLIDSHVSGVAARHPKMFK